jgi:hypothetical protein
VLWSVTLFWRLLLVLLLLLRRRTDHVKKEKNAKEFMALLSFADKYHIITAQFLTRGHTVGTPLPKNPSDMTSRATSRS